jgi:hypothetical protein
LRKDPLGIERQVLNRNPQGQCKRGRPKRTWRRTVEEEIGKVGKKLEPWLRTGYAGDASRKPYSPEGVKENKSCCELHIIWKENDLYINEELNFLLNRVSLYLCSHFSVSYFMMLHYRLQSQIGD